MLPMLDLWGRDYKSARSFSSSLLSKAFFKRGANRICSEIGFRVASFCPVATVGLALANDVLVFALRLLLLLTARLGLLVTTKLAIALLLLGFVGRTIPHRHTSARYQVTKGLLVVGLSPRGSGGSLTAP